ncbi:hypothetical protein [Actinomadura hibisca]|nr:hypothetical protein [Actinomadura hibisca]
MSTPLANPRRTRLMAWPTQGTEDQESEQAGLPAADTATAASEEEHSAR